MNLAWAPAADASLGSECGTEALSASEGATIRPIGENRALVIFARFSDAEQVNSLGQPVPECSSCGDGWEVGTFTDYPPAWADSLLDDSVTAPIPGSLTHYFLEMSQGDHVLVGDVLDSVITVDSTLAQYRATGTTEKAIRHRANKRVLELVDPFVDFADYDAADDGDDTVDYVFIYWQSVRYFDEADSTFFSLSPDGATGVSDLLGTSLTLDDKTIEDQSGSTQWGPVAIVDSQRTEVRHRWQVATLMAHEYGHDLVGHIDVGAAFHYCSVSRYGLMSGFTAPGAMLMEGFLRRELGWIEPLVLEYPTSFPSTQTVTLSTSYLDGKDCFAVVETGESTPGEKQYFMLEARHADLPGEIYNTPMPQDSGCCLPTIRTGTGLLITHVYEGGGGIWPPNSSSSNVPTLGIEVATGKFTQTGAPDAVTGSDLISAEACSSNNPLGNNAGKNSDLYKPGTANTFAPYTNPSSDLYRATGLSDSYVQDVYSGISIYDIEWFAGPTSSRDSIRCKVRFEATSPEPAADTLAVDTRWDGTVQVTGDVVLAATADLTIAEGTQVIVKAGQDLNAAGIDPNRVEIVALGDVVVEGTDAGSVEITSSRDNDFSNWINPGGDVDGGEDTDPATGDWYGLRGPAPSALTYEPGAASGVLDIRYPRTRFGYMAPSMPATLSLAPASVSDFEFDGLFDRDIILESDVVVSYGNGERLGFGPGDAANAPQGRDSERIEIIVQGTLKVDGGTGGRIYFESGAESPAAGDWAGLRFELSGSERTGYGYLGCDVEPSTLESVTISDCVVPITIGDHCAPGLADVDWNRISNLPNSSPAAPAHVLLDSTDVEIPAGWWLDQQGTPVFQEDPVSWSLDHSTNVVATALRSTAEDLPYGTADRVDLLVTGRINATGTHDIVMRPAVRTDADGDDWGGLTISSPYRNQLNRLDIGHAANPVFFFYPDSSSGLTQSTIHHFADLGLWVVGDGPEGAVFQTNSIMQGSGLGPYLGNEGIFLDAAAHVELTGNTVDLSRDQLSTGDWAAVRVHFGKSYCQSQGGGDADTLNISGNEILGNEIETEGHRSGLKFDWVCGAQDQEVDVLENRITGWNGAGLDLFQSVDGQFSCNRVTGCGRAVDVDRNTEPQGSGLRFRTNLLQINAAGKATVRSNNALMTKLGPNTTTKGWNDLEIPTWNVVDPRHFVDENDPGSTLMNATYQFWFENGSLVTDSLAIIARIDQMAGVDIANFADALPLVTPAQLCIPGASVAAPRIRQERADVSGRERPEAVPRDGQLLDLAARWDGSRAVVEVSIPAGREGRCRVAVYDVRGRVVRDWVGELGVGVSRLEFRRQPLPSGVFFVRLTSDDFTGVTRKLVVVR